MSDALLSVRDLRVWYGTERGSVRAVDGVSFHLLPGETLGLVGESGCGKSTLGRSILGLLAPGARMEGEVLFEGDNLVDLPAQELRRLRGPAIGLVFQEPMTRLDPLMRISDQFAETLRTHEPEIEKAEVERRATDALRGMGIPPTRYRNYPHELSGGMRQRTMMALALVLRPRLIVADEPTTALDVLVEAQILSVLRDMQRNFDTALLLITHNLGIVAGSCDRVAVMYAGKMVEQGEVGRVFTQPRHPYTRALLRSTISLSTTGLHYIPGAPPDLIEPPAGCHFHPRCDNAMRVCPLMDPIEVGFPGGDRVSCWLHGPAGLIPEGGTEALARGEIPVAEEA